MRTDTQLWKDAIYARSPEPSEWTKAIPFVEDFIFNNVISTSTILLVSRLMVLAVSLLLALGVFSWAKRLYGIKGGLLALALYSFCPNILAHSSLATEDLLITAFFFMATYSCWLYYEKPVAVRAIGLGVCAALALLSKHSAIILLPALIGAVWCSMRFSSEKPGPRLFRYIPLAAFSLIITILLFYRFIHVDEYFKGVLGAYRYISRGQMSYMAGQYSSTGFWHYFFFTFIAKTTIPALLLGTIGLWLEFQDRLRRRTVFFLFVPAVILLAASIFTPLKIGHRHILPIYPLLYVLCAKITQSPRLKFAALFLLPWHILSAVSIGPHHLEYFNEMFGGAKKGWHYLVDSNIDWGQDLPYLRRYIEQYPDAEVVLIYFGPVPPKSIGFEFQDFMSEFRGLHSHINTPNPKQEILAISVTKLQGVYFAPQLGADPFYWLKTFQPIDRVGHSILIYDITDNAKVHEMLAHYYYLYGQKRHALREAQRALALDGSTTWAKYVAAMVLLDQNRPREALNYLIPAMETDRHPGLTQRMAVTPQVKGFYAQALMNLGVLCLDERKYAEAVRLNYLAGQLDPGNYRALTNLGIAYLKNDQPRLALDAFEQVSKLGIADPIVSHNRTLALKALGYLK
ncbi:MAG: glycosyltransferase family 39 protein [Elusimicrobia bacterium]|nr:glycosyltransferase family 39 protein [Elusimicrobiota bacterium]